jgi:hypothetical protein
MATCQNSEIGLFGQEILISSLEELPANPSQLQDSGKDSKTHAEILCSHFSQLLSISNPSGSFGKMSLESCRPTEEKILVPSSEGWGNWGMGSPTEFLTLNGAEHTGIQEPCRSEEGVCSLSDVLEITSVPQRFYLSKKACNGILRRAKRRGKELPPMLLAALEAVAMAESQAVEENT